jgi:hypothetical protein
MNGHICSFCGLDLDLDQPGSLWLAVGSERDVARQELFAHAKCLAERLHPGVPFDPAVFEPSD